jgi:hypothetical protein
LGPRSGKIVTDNDATRGLSRDAFLYPPPRRSAPDGCSRRLATMYWEESGNPRGVPVIFLHGGPGGGNSPTTAASTILPTTGSSSTTSGAPGNRRR